MLKARTFVTCAGLLALALLLPRPAAAAWPSDPTVNVPVCTASGAQQSPCVLADGAGGAIVAWQDGRGTNDIYAQRISASGVVQWTANGVALCTATGRQEYPVIASDGAGGAIVAWEDYRNAPYDQWWLRDIYAQRISAAGVVQWAADGVALCTVANDQLDPVIAPDGAGGAIVVWCDYRNSLPADNNADVYAQRISATGAIQWTAGGIALCGAADWQGYPQITPDGAGGAIVSWQDARSGKDHIYGQRISAEGAPQWSWDGVALCMAADHQLISGITSDGAGGAISTWQNVSTLGANDIGAQRVSASGAVQWGADGVTVCAATGDQFVPVAASDGANGAIVAWMDRRPGFGADDIYVQRISAGGAVQWTANGVALCTASGAQQYPCVLADGAGGAIVAWQDGRSGNEDVYAQRVSSEGAPQWTANGVALSTASGTQVLPASAPDGVGGAIVTWGDSRVSGTDIYAQAVKGNGELGSLAGVPPGLISALSLDPPRPNPLPGGALAVGFTLPSAAPASIELLDVAGRRVAGREVGSLGAGHHTLDLGERLRLAPGLYLVRLTQGANTRVTRVAVLR